MDGLWYKRCPLCGNYMSKRDPLVRLVCCVCGWNEENVLFFCKTICAYCHLDPGTSEAHRRGP